MRGREENKSWADEIVQSKPKTGKPCGHFPRRQSQGHAETKEWMYQRSVLQAGEYERDVSPEAENIGC